MGPKQVVFTKHGDTGSISIDGVELPYVTNVSIEQDAGCPVAVEVVQRFCPVDMSVIIEQTDMYVDEGSFYSILCGQMEEVT